MRFITSSGEDTELVGEYVFCRFARKYKTFLLYGDLGSGKTTFTRGFARAAGYDHVRSPTFTMVATYPTPSGRILHVDLYRLENSEDFYTLGLTDFLGKDIALIEWADKMPEDVEGVKISFEVFNDRRVITVLLR